MGRLMLLAMGLCALPCLAGEGIPQQHKDAIREYHTQRILATSQPITTLQSDVRLYRELLKTPNTIDHRQLPEPDEIPWARFFKGQTDLTLGQLINLAGAASGYDPVFDKQVNQDELVKINTQANSLADIAEYVTRVSSAQVLVYPDTRSITVTRKPR